MARRGALARWLLISLSIAGLFGCTTMKRLPADWENPQQRVVGETLSPLLQAAGRDPETCEVFFLETEKVNAGSEGGCTFDFTTGLAASGDQRLIAGVAAHEVAHDVLGHADAQRAIMETERGVGDVLVHSAGPWGVVAALGLAAATMVAVPAYSRVQEAEADAKALEILRARGDPDPAGTMAHTMEALIAREGAKGGGILDTHQNTVERLQTMRTIQANEPRIDLPPSAAEIVSPVLPTGRGRTHVVEMKEPRDPREDWSERYKQMLATAEKENAERSATKNGDAE